MKPTYWSGSDESWNGYLASMKKVEEYMARENREELKPPSLYVRNGNVGTISISGHLVSGMTSPIYMYFGIIGYENIKLAIAEGVKDKAAAKLMLIANSGGGAVDGCADCAHFIRAAASLKPMNTYANFAASACYWLASAGGHITGSDTSITGSIGVMKIHSEYSEMDKKMGIKTTVLRAGENKARLNPYEPLTKEVLAQEQVKLDYLHNRFISTVAQQRGVSAKTVRDNYGDGSTYIGEMALDVGLIDAVGDMASALAYAKTNEKKLDKSKIVLVVTPAPVNPPDNSAQLTKEDISMDEDIVPTAEDLAALAGATAEDVTPKTPEAVDTPSLADVQLQVTTLQTEAAAKDQKIADLTSQLAAANEAKATAEAAVATANETIEALNPAVRNSVKHLAVSLNKSVNAAELGGKELAASYAELSEAFKASFQKGAKSKPTAAVGKEGEQVANPDINKVQANTPDPFFAMRVQTLAK